MLKNIKDIESRTLELDQEHKELEKKQSDTIMELKGMKMELINNLNELHSEIKDTNKQINQVDEAICKLTGHEFSEWEEKPDKFQDRSWYWERRCNSCGKVETSRDYPKTLVK